MLSFFASPIRSDRTCADNFIIHHGNVHVCGICLTFDFFKRKISTIFLNKFCRIIFTVDFPQSPMNNISDSPGIGFGKQPDKQFFFHFFRYSPQIVVGRYFCDDFADILFESKLYDGDLIVKFIGRVMPQNHHRIFVRGGPAEFHSEFLSVIQQHC